MEKEVQAAVSALGCLEGENYEKEPDCHETIKDLIRYLRRDTDTSSYNVRRQLLSLNVMENDLIPIIRTYSENAELFENCLKLLINLTQPIGVKKSNEIAEAEVAEKSSEILSHRLRVISDLKRTKRSLADEKFFTILTAKLTKLLNLDWKHRQEEDRILIERILILIRNILHIPPPDEDFLEKSSLNLTTHDQIIWSMHNAKLDDLVLDLACNESHREYHVYVLEIICLLLRQHAPEVLTSAGVDQNPDQIRREQKELASMHEREASKINKIRRATGRPTTFSGSYTVYGMKALDETKNLVSPRPVVKPEDLLMNSRKRGRKIPSNRAPAKESVADLFAVSTPISSGRSRLEIRLALKELCRRFCEIGYNKFMHSIQYALERRDAAADGGSRYHFWWLMRYCTAFVRYDNGGQGELLNWKYVGETMSLHCLHDAQTQLEECLDFIKMEKKEARQWGRKAHMILGAYRELLAMMQKMEKSKDNDAIDAALELKRTIFYVMEYRELLISLLKKFNPAVFTKTFLKDLVETTHIYLKALESHCLIDDQLKVQQKRKRRRQPAKKTNEQVVEQQQEEPKGPEGLTEEEIKIRLEERWQNLADDLSTLLQKADNDPGLLPKDVIPFDSVADHGFDEKVVAQIRIQNAIKSQDFSKAVALLRVSIQIWPEETTLFGLPDFSAPEDDFLLLRNIFFKEMPVVPGENDKAEESKESKDEDADASDQGVQELANGDKDDSDASSEGCITTEVQFSFNQYVQRYAHSDILRWYVMLLADFESNTAQLNHCLTKMMHRVAYDLKLAPMLYQARLFRVFQKLLNSTSFANSPGAKELEIFAKYLLSGFFVKAATDKNVLVEILFWKDFKGAFEIDHGYGSYAGRENPKSKKKRQKKKNNGHIIESPSNSEPEIDMDMDTEFRASTPRPDGRSHRRLTAESLDDKLLKEASRIERDMVNAKKPQPSVKRKRQRKNTPATTADIQPDESVIKFVRNVVDELWPDERGNGSDDSLLDGMLWPDDSPEHHEKDPSSDLDASPTTARKKRRGMVISSDDEDI